MTVRERPPKAELEALYVHSSLVDIARHYGVGATTVKKWFREANIPRRGHGTRRTVFRSNLGSRR